MVKTKRGLPEMTYIPDRELYRKRGTYKGQRYNITAKKPEDVMEKIEAFKKRIDSGIIDDNITLWQYVQRWYPLRVAGLTPKSKEPINNALQKYILPKLGNMKLTEIKPLHIEELLTGISKMSSSLTQKVLTNLNLLFNHAIENNVLLKNPCINRTAGGVKTKPKTPLTKEQQEILTVAVRGTRAELFTLLCLYAGLRREEALGLLWENVHLDDGTPRLDVRHTTTFESNGTATHSPNLKTPAAYRTIPLPPQLTEALRRQRETNDSPFVVPAEKTGKEMSQAAFEWLWAAVIGRKSKSAKKDDHGNPIIIKTPGVADFHVEPHILRHTYITRLCASRSLDIKKIQYLAGHKDARITLNIYAKVTENQPGELAPDIISIFTGTPAGTPGTERK
jgi:integrase